MKTILSLLASTILLSSCGVVHVTRHQVDPKLVSGTVKANGVTTKISFMGNSPFDKPLGKLYGAWSPVVVVTSGRSFDLSLRVHGDGAPSTAQVRVDSVFLIKPDGSRQALPMTISDGDGNPLTWRSPYKTSLYYHTENDFKVPDDDAWFLEIKASTRRRTGAGVSQFHQRWKLEKSTTQEGGIGFKSA